MGWPEAAACSTRSRVSWPLPQVDNRMGRWARFDSSTLIAIGLSSTISTERPLSPWGSTGEGGATASPNQAVARKVVPAPTSLLASMLPSIKPSRWRQMVRPRPVPP